ncbi:hypothetical protein H0H81_006464 [Sphagnurus paluster]|uniref:Uncharacterized protein n=1 Tax=Sphagnurus paluster TaxID=117069 RepID=A0A9P7FQX6_9AGAR|nr:hypothetical protein H0H81_006464 [Sphagnurus paluster]
MQTGRGALSQHGDFWYPVRLIQKVEGDWRVQWWRGAHFTLTIVVAGGISLVEPADIVDSVWLDCKNRRMIWLRRWKHTCEVENSEDILADPTRIPYTKDIDDLLSPFRDILSKLTTHQFEDLKGEVISVKSWLEGTKRPLTSTLVPHVGSLSVLGRARIANWFDVYMTLKDKEIRLSWLGYLPIAHAYTLYIAHSLTFDEKTVELSWEELLGQAWKVQLTGTPSWLVDVDVECECLYQLKEEMFKVSA